LSLLTAPTTAWAPHSHLVTQRVLPTIHPTEPQQHGAKSPPRTLARRCITRRPNSELHNLLTDLTNLLTNNGGVESETDLPYHPPFSEELSIASRERTFAVRERA
jgi:hypothetical protein